jgi:poly-gamma-glutamate synthesis protein (capsule biosynthesis protein)
VNAGPGHDDPQARIATWDEARVAQALAAARRVADVVVVSIHWSHDFWQAPRSEERDRARFLVENGADVVLGHGPHVLHPVERLMSPRGQALCAYSLGNLVSNQGFAYRVGHDGLGHEATWRPDSRDGAWLRVGLRLEGGRIAIDAVEAVPLFTYNNFFARDADLEPAEDIRVQRLADVDDPMLRAERRATIAAALGPAVTLVER